MNAYGAVVPIRTASRAIGYSPDEPLVPLATVPTGLACHRLQSRRASRHGESDPFLDARAIHNNDRCTDQPSQGMPPAQSLCQQQPKEATAPSGASLSRPTPIGRRRPCHVAVSAEDVRDERDPAHSDPAPRRNAATITEKPSYRRRAQHTHRPNETNIDSLARIPPTSRCCESSPRPVRRP